MQGCGSRGTVWSVERVGLSWQEGDTTGDTAAPAGRCATLSPRRSRWVSGRAQVLAAKTIWVQEQRV